MNRDWTVLFIGGASGSGKSSIAYELARYYNVNVLEVDDIFAGIKAMTRKEDYPMIHYWDNGVNWRDVGISGNLNWLRDVSKELIPGIKAVVDNHLEGDVPVIIEGDFLYPEFMVSFQNPKVKSIFIYEPDKDQIVQNYLAREGGELQNFRADVSAEYGAWLVDAGNKLGIKVIESRPWKTTVYRTLKCIS